MVSSGVNLSGLGNTQLSVKMLFLGTQVNFALLWWNSRQNNLREWWFIFSFSFRLSLWCWGRYGRAAPIVWQEHVREVTFHFLVDRQKPDYTPLRQHPQWLTSKGLMASPNSAAVGGQTFSTWTTRNLQYSNNYPECVWGSVSK